ncbi:hypothetical protein [Actinomadura livida]|uniref:Uncharacterized protein n=1 Tax=Actinomadura livida TaxID=79909 RepID=A0A7W7MZA2_9ACTN|nr:MULTISPECIES: hypothetical protein [Actinomadura]MBB4775640.1 hypothetical protein [Actinomadura catellatispora]GGU34083.1 hypothetical protein GCM10010208_68270 [Actinomadura livida]
MAPILAGTAGYIAFAVLLMLFVLDTSGWLHRTEKLGDVHRQPASVTYEDEHGGPRAHYVGLLHERSFVFGRHRAYQLFVGPEPNFGYGHFIDFDHGAGPGGPPAVKSVTWDARGVRVTFTTGHEVFVPADAFVGAR